MENKKAYVRPRLVEYGSMQEIVMGIVGPLNDTEGAFKYAGES